MHDHNDSTKDKAQCFKGRRADQAVKEKKVKDQQNDRPTVFCEDDALENVFKFIYLGTVYAADGLQDYDIRARMAKAMAR